VKLRLDLSPELIASICADAIRNGYSFSKPLQEWKVEEIEAAVAFMVDLVWGAKPEDQQGPFTF
jgi:hypothetical protein